MHLMLKSSKIVIVYEPFKNCDIPNI